MYYVQKKKSIPKQQTDRYGTRNKKEGKIHVMKAMLQRRDKYTNVQQEGIPPYSEVSNEQAGLKQLRLMRCLFEVCVVPLIAAHRMGGLYTRCLNSISS